MARTYFHDWTLDDEREVEIEFTATPWIAATWDDPAEGGEIEVVQVYLKDEAETPIEISDEERWKIEGQLAETDWYDDDGPDADDWRDQMIDDRLTGGDR